MALNEMIQYYQRNNTDTFVMMLDASKACDHSKYLKLFNILANK